MAFTPFEPPYPETSCYMQTSWLCVYKTGVMADESFIFDLFCSFNLDLDPMTFIYELDPYSLEIYRSPGVQRSRLWKVIV